MMVMEDEASYFDPLFSLMADSDNEKEKPALNLTSRKSKDYSLSKLRFLAFVLIDCMNDLAKDKKTLGRYFKNIRKK